VYFASIAAARLHHIQQISKLDDSIVIYGLQACRKMSWLDEATRRVIDAALIAVDAASPK
jgi:hypothetical protein